MAKKKATKRRIVKKSPLISVPFRAKFIGKKGTEYEDEQCESLALLFSSNPDDHAEDSDPQAIGCPEFVVLINSDGRSSTVAYYNGKYMDSDFYDKYELVRTPNSIKFMLED